MSSSFVDCPDCEGSGRDFSDIMDAYDADGVFQPRHPDCERCEGDGFLWADEVANG